MMKSIKFEYTTEQLYAIVRKLENVPDDVCIEVNIVDCPMTEEDDEWISNIGRDVRDYPETLNSNTYIQVKYRDGSYSDGKASEWGSPWRETDGCPSDIVAYRVMK